jgi:hypothetical protein
MKPLAFTAIVLATVVAGCNVYNDRTYDSVADLRRSNDYSIEAAKGVPDDARSIHVNLDVEMNDYYISYVTASPGYALQALGLAAVSEDAVNRSRDSLGYGFSLSRDVDVYAGCRDGWPPAPPGELGRKEITFAASSNGRQYLWNELLDDELIRQICSADGGESVR